MSSNVLAGLVARVISTGEDNKLTEDEKKQFYSDFECEISQPVEKIRAEKRRAFEEMKNIAVR